MASTDLSAFIQWMQASIAPAMIISGLAFLLSIIAGRFTRCIDRIRVLLAEIRHSPNDTQHNLLNSRQIRILYRRAGYLRTTLILNSLSIFFITLNVICTYLSFIYEIQIERVLSWFFILSMICLIISVSLVIRDFFISLAALKIEIKGQIPIPLDGEQPKQN